MTAPEIDITETENRGQWRRLMTAAAPTPLEQSWGYGAAVAAVHGQTVRRLVVALDGAPAAAVQLFRRAFPGGFALARIVRGPVWTGPLPAPAVQAEIFRRLRGAIAARRRDLLLWLPEFEESSGQGAVMRAAGMRRVTTGYSSAWLDLSAGAAALRAGLRPKWRNALGGAERGGLAVRRETTPAALAALIAACDTFRRRRRFVGPTGPFLQALTAAGRDRPVALSATLGGEAVAGLLCVRHDGAATYYAGWTGAEGRRRNAHNLLLWQAMLELSRAGAGWLDLGGISAAAPGIARFKLGLGGRFFTLSGTYM